jgi:hypothetical protein
MAILITRHGDVIDKYDASDLNKKQKAVGGYIEYVRTNLDMTFCVNEDAALIGLEPNLIATGMAGILLLGDVLLVDNKEIEKEDRI